MFRYYLLTFGFLLIAATSFAVPRKSDLVLDSIPISILPHADAVMRKYEMNVDVLSSSEIQTREYYVITVLNENGNKYAYINEHYDNKFEKITDIYGTVYDKDNEQISTIHKSDLTDEASYGSNLVDDFRHKYYRCKYQTFPYTIEYTVERSYNSSFFMPVWTPLQGLRCATQEAKLTVNWGDSLTMRYKVDNSDVVPAVKKKNGGSTLTASMLNIPAMKEEDPFSNRMGQPCIWLTLNDLTLDGRRGSMDTWENIGKFFYQLNEGRDDLPDNIKKTVHQLSDTCKTVKSKISVLYEYLKKNQRYVAIQLGVGGWQTLDAKFVAEKNYGDCKALSNYMKALLKEAGVPSYATLVYGGDTRHWPVDAAYPSNRFNHVILCVPVPEAHDTTWLECTSKDLPAGYLSEFTGNRHVLMMTSDGGKLVKTPSYGQNENHLERTAIIDIDTNDNIKGKMKMRYTGSFWNREQYFLKNTTREKMEEHFNSKFKFPSCHVMYSRYDELMVRGIPGVDEEVDIQGSANISHTDKRFFLSADFLSAPVSRYKDDDKRTKPFAISGYCVSDSIIVKLTGNYDKEHLPGEVSISKPFGSYYQKAEMPDANTIIIKTFYCQKAGTYDASAFQEYLAMRNRASSGVNEKLVFLKRQQ